MDNTKAFAKVILAAIGIFYIVKIVPMTIQSVVVAISSRSLKSSWPILVSLFIISAAVFFLWYFFCYRRSWLAEKIIGTAGEYETEGEIPWFPAALRLVCIFAGLYCFCMVLKMLSMYLQYFRHFARDFVIYRIIELPLLLIVGIYLVCGAPHFVRWQVKKTLEQCRKLENDKSASN